MKFGIMAFSAGFFIQFGGYDMTRHLYVRFQTGYVWRGIYRTLWTWMAKDPIYGRQDAA